MSITNQYTLKHLLHQSRKVNQIAAHRSGKETKTTILPFKLSKKHSHKQKLIQRRVTKFDVHKPIKRNTSSDLEENPRVQSVKQIYDSTTSKLKTTIYFKINPMPITSKVDALKNKCINYLNIKAS